MNDNQTTYFELKNNGDFIRINLIELSHPYAELDCDRSWIKANVTVKAG